MATTADSQPDTKEKMDDCLVCLMPTRERSNDLFLYNCRCVYAIHANCFRDWRRTTETNRICLICREGLDTFEDFEVRDTAPLLRPIPVRPAYGIVRAWFHPNALANTNKNICLAGFFIFLVVLFFRHLTDKSPQITEPPFYLGALGGQRRLLL